MNTAWFRFYEELNDYLPEEKQKVWFGYSFHGNSPISEVIQLMGIPADEIDLILINQKSRGLDYNLNNGDHISVYPVFELFDISGTSKVREKPLRNPKFICDVHLGRLSKYMRMLGFDTTYSNQFAPEEIICISNKEDRIILSKSLQITCHDEVNRSYWIRSSDSLEQLKDLVDKLDLVKLVSPLTRCLNCNQMIEPVEKKEINQRLQPKTEKYYNEFLICRICDKIYWKGSHYESMMEFVDKNLQD